MASCGGQQGDGGGEGRTWMPRGGALGRRQQGRPELVEATSSSTQLSLKSHRRRSGAGRVGCLHLAAVAGRLAGGATRAPCSTRCAELQVGERRLFRTGKKRLGNEPSLRHEAVGWEPSAALWRSWAPWQAARAHHDALTPHLSIASRLDSWRVNQRGTPSQTTGKSNRTFETPITRFVCRQINLQIHTRGARDRSAKLQSKAWLQ